MLSEVFKLYKNKKFSIDRTCQELINLSYKRLPSIEEPGDFSIKGEVMELFPVNFELPLRITWQWDDIDKIQSFIPGKNLTVEEFDIINVLPNTSCKKPKYQTTIPLNPILKIKENDLVVHIDYGIGIYRGKKTFDINNPLPFADQLIFKDSVDKSPKEKIFLEIEYRDKNKIYIPIEKAHLIQKYTYFSHKKPKLSSIKTPEWKNILKRTTQGIKQYALEIIRTQALREILGGFSFSSNSTWEEDFAKTFQFQETPDQIKAWNKTKQLMENKIPMDMLICGDVGYGKTEIAMRAAFKAALDSKQVAFLVPTTILAEQHYINLNRRLTNFPVKCAMLSRFKSRQEQKQIITDLKKGNIDIIIGTHRLLSSDIEFKDLGLLIIDEEQKFGVRQKERLKKLKVGIDVLNLTATPIPRTLYMSLSGIKSMADIRTPPKNRLAIETQIIDFNLKKIEEIIIREKSRNGQIFFIDNRIKNLFKIKKSLDSALKDKVSTSLAYGQMPTHQLEKIMLDFINGDVDCLISTAIVESGIDIPKSNTIIINNAHLFGLADLHQLRGRVGRSQNQGFCYLIIPKRKSMPQEAIKRIRAIEEYSYLGAGFDIATRDLEIRGAGNILGTKQHGFIWAVGFDLYCRILKNEIENLKDLFKT